MVNPAFTAVVETVAAKFEKLMSAPLLHMRGGPSHAAKPGIYIFYEDGSPVHVGRTRNLRRRLQGHCSESRHQASFAFKRARELTGRFADYKTGNSRAALFKETEFRAIFGEQVVSIRGMNYRFLEIIDPVEQYLLELYTAIELGTSMDEFDTH